MATKPIELLTELELVDLYIDNCLNFVNPTIFNHIRNRGLYNIINYLPRSKDEARKVARLRMYESGKLTKVDATPETQEAISFAESRIKMIKDLQERIFNTDPAELDIIREFAESLIQVCLEPIEI